MTFDLRHFHPQRPPALLLGGVNLVRALGLGGIPAIVASPRPDAPANVSRYAHGSLLLPPLESRDALLETLVRFGERLADALGSKIALVYGSDDFLNLIQEHHAALAPYYALILNDPEVAHALIDKDRFEAFGRSRGLPVPRTLQWEELDGWYAPLLVKPKMKVGFYDSALCRRLFGAAGKACVFASGPEFSATPLARQMRDQVLLQEYIPGDDRNIWSFHGYADENGKLLASFIGRKIRTDPPLVGMSSYLELAHDDAFAVVGRHVAARAGLKGVFKIDFKQNAMTGAWRVLEVNARFNLWHYLAARNGLNLPRIAYDYLLYGKKPAAQAYRTEWRWLALRHDYRSYRALAARGELSAWAWLRSILEAPKVYELFSWTDPLPFVRNLVAKSRRMASIPLRVKRWLSTAF
jgi:predicted ATP-grasp superfamily ATP-dependent carboligase